MRNSLEKSPISLKNRAISLKIQLSPTNSGKRSPLRNKHASFRAFSEFVNETPGNSKENRENQGKTSDFLLIRAENSQKTGSFRAFALVFEAICREILENAANFVAEVRFCEVFPDKTGYKAEFEPIFIENTRKLHEITQDFASFLDETHAFAEIFTIKRDKTPEIVEKTRLLQVFGEKNCENLLINEKNPQFVNEKLENFALNAQTLVISSEIAENLAKTIVLLGKLGKFSGNCEKTSNFQEESRLLLENELRNCRERLEILDFQGNRDVFQGIPRVSLINECISCADSVDFQGKSPNFSTKLEETRNLLAFARREARNLRILLCEERQKCEFYREKLGKLKENSQKVADFEEFSRVCKENRAFSEEIKEFRAKIRSLCFENEVFQRQIRELCDLEEKNAGNSPFSQEIEEFSKDLLSFEGKQAVSEAKRVKEISQKLREKTEKVIENEGILKKMMRICVDFKYQIVILRWKLAEFREFQGKSQGDGENLDVFREILAVLHEDYRLWSKNTRKTEEKARFYEGNREFLNETLNKSEESADNYRDISIKNENLRNFASLVKPKRFIPNYYWQNTCEKG